MLNKILLAASVLNFAEARLDFSLIADDWTRFEHFAKTFGKTYADDHERRHRFMAFLENEEEIERLNKEENGATFGWTKFSDMTKAEFKKFLNFATYDKRRHAELQGDIPVAVPKNVTLASAYDWRDHGKVTPVKNQMACGSCWAFSATETVESAYLMANPNTNADNFALSPQQIVSCDQQDGGCGGGDLPSAFRYVMSAGGLSTEAEYPYTSGYGQTGSCVMSEVQPMAGTKPSKYSYATPGCSGSCTSQDENTLAANIQTVGPVGICVNAENWQNYNSGVMSPSQCGGSAYWSLDHCVQLVAFKQNEYWTIRNSWDTNWGEDGFIRVSYGDNTCGVADEAMFVTL